MKRCLLTILSLVLVIIGITIPQATSFALSVTYNTCPTFATLKADAENASYPNTLTFNVAGGCDIDFGGIGNNLDLYGDVTILNTSGTVVFRNSDYMIYVDSATLIIDNIHFTQASQYGAIYAEYSTVTISNSRFYDNFSDYGGAIYLDETSLTVSNSVFEENVADDYGGAIYAYDSAVSISGSQFTGNYAYYYGGAIYVEDGSLTVSGSTFTANYVTDTFGYGGAIYVQDSPATVSGSVFANNDGVYVGGAIAAYDDVLLTVTGSTFYGNYAYYGGAIEVEYGNVVISHSSFYNNEGYYGGALYNYYNTYYGGSSSVSNSTFYNNSAEYGGAIYGDDATVTYTHVTIANNIAYYDGASLYIDYGTATFIASIITGGDCYLDGGSITDGGNNVQFNAPDCVGVDADPLLGAFAGGVMYPAAGSPAIDIYGAPCLVATDQLGTARPIGAGCDAGATEGDGATVVVAPVAGPEVLGCVFNSPNGMEIGNVPDNTYCTVLMRNGSVVNYPGAVPADLMGLGVIFAVDVFRMEGGQSITQFPSYGRICLRGNGRMFYLDARNAPRTYFEMPTQREGGLTCAWIPAPGTLVLTN